MMNIRLHLRILGLLVAAVASGCARDNPPNSTKPASATRPASATMNSAAQPIQTQGTYYRLIRDQAVEDLADRIRIKAPDDIQIDGPRRCRDINLWNWDQNVWPGYSITLWSRRKAQDIASQTGPTSPGIVQLFVLDPGYTGTQLARTPVTSPAYTARPFAVWRGRRVLLSGGDSKYWPDALTQVGAALQATDTTAGPASQPVPDAPARQPAGQAPAAQATPSQATASPAPAAAPATAPAYQAEQERVGSVLPRHWSLKVEVRDWGRHWIVQPDKPMRVVHNSPLAPGPVEQTLAILIIPGPKVSPAEYERMTRHNASALEKFRGPPQWRAGALWWEDSKGWIYRLPTHSSQDASLLIDCRPLAGGTYEIPSRQDAAEAARVLDNMTASFAPHAAASRPSRPATPQEFLAALEAGPDAVAAAIGFLRGRPAPPKNEIMDLSIGLDLAALDFLVDHWKDPRCQAALAEIAASGRAGGGGIQYHPGEAWTRLVPVRARRGAQAILAGAGDASDVLARVRKAFADNPIEGPDATQRAALRARLAEIALQRAGGDAADVVLLGGDRSSILEVVRRHPAGTVEHLRKIGAGPILSRRHGVLSLVVEARPQGLQALLEEWLAGETDALYRRTLVLELCNLGDEARRREFLSSPRREEYETAARHIESQADAAGLKGLQDELERRRKAGAGRDELDLFEDAIRGGAQKMKLRASREGRHEPPATPPATQPAQGNAVTPRGPNAAP